jgi:hypothetical protein
MISHFETVFYTRFMKEITQAKQELLETFGQGIEANDYPHFLGKFRGLQEAEEIAKNIAKEMAKE